MTESQVMEALDIWKNSLQSSLAYIKNLKLSLKWNKKRLLIGEALPFGPYSGQAALWEEELHQEIAYGHLLRVLDAVFDTLQKSSSRQLVYKSTLRQKLSKQLDLEMERIRFLEKHTRYHLKMLKSGLSAYCKLQRAFKVKGSVVKHKHNDKAANYLAEKGLFVIDEPKLELRINAKFQPETVPDHLLPCGGQESKVVAIIGKKWGKEHGQTLWFYPSGSIKIDSYYEEGELHGPWSYFAESGNLLVKSWFVYGQRQGRSCYYYHSGQLYSIQTYRQDQPHGQWRYYYQDGTLKTLENYDDGSLHGVVQLYYPNGCLKKELHFKQGKLCGKERLWSVNGALIFESSYGV
jgi:antitoxin component YwqK of YwqJK toxin-antitoxin module